MNMLSNDMPTLLPHELPQTGGFVLHYMMLYSIVYGMEAKKVFEFGCGYSSQVILAALTRTGGSLTTAEKRDIKDTGNTPELLTAHAGRWRYIQKLSGDVIKEDITGESYDVVLHDGAHEVKTVFWDIRGIVRHMKQDAILLVHDTNHKTFPYLRWAVRLALLPYRYEMVTVPYGFGLTIVRIKSNFGHGKVTLTWKKEKGGVTE
jgi:predicted O-methyltransferase YrrM